MDNGQKTTYSTSFYTMGADCASPMARLTLLAQIPRPHQKINKVAIFLPPKFDLFFLSR